MRPPGTGPSSITSRSATTSRRRSASSSATTSSGPSVRCDSARGHRAARASGSTRGRERSDLVNGADRLESRQQGGRFATEFQNSDVLTVAANRYYELLVRPFAISPGVIIPPGSYPFGDITTSYAFGQQRRVSGTVSLQRGQFYDGDITAVAYTAGRVAVLKQWSVEPSVSVNR